MTVPGSRKAGPNDQQALPHNTDQKLLRGFYEVVTPPPRIA
jgi:hypothetical protein